MAVFKSQHPQLDIPTDLTVWDWLFDSPWSPIANVAESGLAGYQDAMTKERLDWKQVKELSTYISTALTKGYGLKRDETVSLFSQNNIWYPVAMFGAIRAGGVVSGASSAYNVEEMTHALKTAQAKFLITNTASLKVAVTAATRVGIPKSHIFTLEDQSEGFKSIQDLVRIGKEFGPQDQIPALKLQRGTKNSEVCGFLSFSSGTTGMPKAVMISHGNIIAQLLQVQQITLEDHKQVLGLLPFYHVTGLVHIVHLPILLNAEVVILSKFTLPLTLQAIMDYQIREVLLVPPIIIRLVRDPQVDTYDLSCIKRFSSGGAPLSDEILRLLAKKFSKGGFKQGYGLTESCACITGHPVDRTAYKYAFSVGAIVANTEVRIVDTNGRDCGVNEPGEILARGPQIVMGYLNNAKATQETFDSDGWLHTGDQGRIDEDGLMYITDRIKELIKVKGIGVAPAELEDLLLGHKDVEDVAVVGISDEMSGEVPKAFVVLKPGVPSNTATGNALLQFTRDNKARHKWVKEIEFTAAIPKSPSGKILRKDLRELEKSGNSPTGIVVKKAKTDRAKL